MNSLEKFIKMLTKEDIKSLHKALNQKNSDFFGNTLKKSKQDSYMASLFGVKNYNTLLGMANQKEIDYEEKIKNEEIEVRRYYTDLDSLIDMDIDRQIKEEIIDDLNENFVKCLYFERKNSKVIRLMINLYEAKKQMASIHRENIPEEVEIIIKVVPGYDHLVEEIIRVNLGEDVTQEERIDLHQDLIHMGMGLHPRVSKEDYRNYQIKVEYFIREMEKTVDELISAGKRVR